MQQPLPESTASQPGEDDPPSARLYQEHARAIFAYIRLRIATREEAEDVLQEVFLQVWRRAADFDERRGRPFTWLVTLTRSRAIDRLRQLNSRERLVSSDAEVLAFSVLDPAQDAFRSEQRELVAGALAELSEEQRYTLTLAYFEGLTQSEIAARLSSPLGTVKTRMRSGMIRLRELLSRRIASQAL